MPTGRRGFPSGLALTIACSLAASFLAGCFGPPQQQAPQQPPASQAEEDPLLTTFSVREGFSTVADAEEFPETNPLSYKNPLREG